MSTHTLIELGELRTEFAASIDHDGGVGYGPILHRPLATPVLNDGRHHYWMVPGERYVVWADAGGWRVSGWSWDTTHAYRLAAADDWHYVDTLPTTQGAVLLKSTLRYLIEPTGPSTWILTGCAGPIQWSHGL